jgi:hypothetical protein
MSGINSSEILHGIALQGYEITYLHVTQDCVLGYHSAAFQA